MHLSKLEALLVSLLAVMDACPCVVQPPPVVLVASGAESDDFACVLLRTRPNITEMQILSACSSQLQAQPPPWGGCASNQLHQEFEVGILHLVGLLTRDMLFM